MPTQGRAPACTRVCICLYSAAPVWSHLLIDYACLGSCHVPSQGRAAACTRVCMCLHSAVYRCKLIRLALGPVACLLRVALPCALGSACPCARQHLIAWRLPWVLSYAYSGSRSRVYSGLHLLVLGRARRGDTGRAGGRGRRSARQIFGWPARASVWVLVLVRLCSCWRVCARAGASVVVLWLLSLARPCVTPFLLSS